MAPVTAQKIIPLNAEGCQQADDFNRVLLRAYRHQADMDSNLFVRFYNQAIKEWISQLIIIDGRPIICVKSTPMRAFSTYRHLLINELNWKGIPEDMDDLTRFPLPFANFTRGIPKPNKELQQSAYPIRNIGFLDETMKRRTAWSRYPRALIIPYTVDLWCKYESHMDYMLQLILEQFIPVAYYEVRSPFSDTTIPMAIKMAGEPVDNSDLEKNDTDDRLLRLTLNLEVYAWMFYDIMQAPTFQIETDEVIALPSGAEETLEGGETVFIKTFKHTELAPLTLAEIAATTSEDVPPLQP